MHGQNQSPAARGRGAFRHVPVPCLPPASPGAQQVAENVRTLLTDSEILGSHRNCGKVQDPYCLRCVPQVHGASRDALRHATEIMEREINSVTDNPLVFEDGDVISAGNFHGQPLALALDYAGIALAELASISERRIYLLLEWHDGLPELLMEDTGLNSGYMMLQYTAVALLSDRGPKRTRSRM
jgi:histidine ammonia-lyase